MSQKTDRRNRKSFCRFHEFHRGKTRKFAEGQKYGQKRIKTTRVNGWFALRLEASFTGHGLKGPLNGLLPHHYFTLILKESFSSTHPSSFFYDFFSCKWIIFFKTGLIDLLRNLL